MRVLLTSIVDTVIRTVSIVAVRLLFRCSKAFEKATADLELSRGEEATGM